MAERNVDFVDLSNRDVGRLNVNPPQRSNGKKVFEWDYSAFGSSEKLLIEVVLHVEKNAESGEDSLVFKATCDKPKLSFKNSDINELRREVDEALTARAALISGIAWEDWFEVSVSGGSSDFDDAIYAALGSNLKIEIKKLKRGVSPKTGQLLTISQHGDVMPFPKPQAFSDEPVRMFGSKGERSYIPATPENRAALDDILGRMGLLRTKLANFLSQENIQGRLVAMDVQLPLLPDLSEPKPLDWEDR